MRERCSIYFGRRFTYKYLHVLGEVRRKFAFFSLKKKIALHDPSNIFLYPISKIWQEFRKYLNTIVYLLMDL